jgi:hypothetical protein
MCRCRLPLFESPVVPNLVIIIGLYTYRVCKSRYDVKGSATSLNSHADTHRSISDPAGAARREDIIQFSALIYDQTYTFYPGCICFLFLEISFKMLENFEKRFVCISLYSMFFRTFSRRKDIFCWWCKTDKNTSQKGLFQYRILLVFLYRSQKNDFS